MSSVAAVDRLRLSELIGSLSLATDLGLGQPSEHVLRSCVVGLRIADRLELDDAERTSVYYVAQLAWVGCHSDSFEQAGWFGDDIELRASTYDVDLPGPGWALRRVGSGRSPLRRAGMLASFAVRGEDAMAAIDLTHCRVAGELASALGLGPEISEALQQAFTRWDGKGYPAEIAGEKIALPVRIVHVADMVEAHRARGGIEAAIAVASERSGTQLDPDLCRLVESDAEELLGGLEEPSPWEQALALAPELGAGLAGAAVDEALEAVADFTDLKSPWFAGHSRRVSVLVASAGERSGLSPEAVTRLRRAALLHDVGRIGIPNTIWDKPGPLSHAELERVRLYPYLTRRVFAKSAFLEPLASLAARHAERLDGSGYPSGLEGEAIGIEARLLAAADAYSAMRERRPHRPAKPAEIAAAELRDAVSAGRLDGEAVEAVLGAAGIQARRRRSWPGGLTSREVEVLRLLATGSTNKEIAAELVISPKTAGNHVEHIYTKLGCSTRAQASLFAMRHGLLEQRD